MDYQDVLAAVGAGSAHPGGAQSTQQWLDHLQLEPSTRVLEVGCGTGRTLLSIKERYGCRVTGVDVRPEMIQKARIRAAQAGLSAQWRVASAEQLPFPDASFDVVFTESVNVFIDPTRGLAEYHRVLVPGGWYVDVEMTLMAPVSEDWKKSVHEVYGARVVPDWPGWRKLYRSAGFSTVEVLSMRSVRPEDSMVFEQQALDEHKLASPGAFQNPQVIAVLTANAKWLEQHSRPLGYVIVRCRKALSQA